MALNKFMHPRNIYKTAPDFSKLSKTYPEFSSIALTDVSGKVTINFKDPNSLRILTKCLLKADFNLNVDIPKDRLVPTLPLRLNYILWVEDVLEKTEYTDCIHGLDIGTGACAIYPLLAVVMHKWHMVGTETNDKSIQIANENVKNNNLQDLITIKKNPTSSIVEFIFKEESEKQFNFCMCNPPFYSSIHELYDSRSPARPEPKNAFTGSLEELVTEGGELEFCRKLIKESCRVRNKIKIFTTMVGHKSNLKELVLNLKEENITNYTTTEFCQGRVTRWGLAWTFLEYDLYKLLPPREKLRKKPSSIIYTFPKLFKTPYDLNNVSKKLLEILDSLNIRHKVLNKRANIINFDVVSYENTWSNQRRKRRLLKRLEAENTKKMKIKPMAMEEPNISLSASKKSDSLEKSTEHVISSKTVIHAFFKISQSDPDIVLETEFIDGIAGKEGLHQIVQYIKNAWK